MQYRLERKQQAGCWKDETASAWHANIMSSETPDENENVCILDDCQQKVKACGLCERDCKRWRWSQGKRN